MPPDGTAALENDSLLKLFVHRVAEVVGTQFRGIDEKIDKLALRLNAFETGLAEFKSVSETHLASLRSDVASLQQDRSVPAIPEASAAQLQQLSARADTLSSRSDRFEIELAEQAQLVNSAGQLFKEAGEQLRGSLSELREQIKQDVLAEIPVPEPGKPGTDADMGAVMLRVDEVLDKQIDQLPALARALVQDAVSRIEIPKPRDGIDVDMDEVRSLIIESVKAHTAEIPALVHAEVAGLPVPEPAKPGKDCDMDLVRNMVQNHFAEHAVTFSKEVASLVTHAVKVEVAALPKPQDGKSIELREIKELVDGAVEKAVAALPKPRDGNDVDMNLLLSLVDAHLAKAISELPKPEKGQDATVDYKALHEFIRKEIEAMPKPKDGEPGLPGVSPEIDYARVEKKVSELVAEEVELQQLGLMVEKSVTAAIGTLPKPKDGEPGKVDYNEIERMVLAAVSGSPKLNGELEGRVQHVVASAMASLPRPRDGRDATFREPITWVSNAERTYPYNTIARYAGGIWHATRDDVKGDAVPGSENSGWRLLVDGIAGVDIKQTDARHVKFTLTCSSGSQLSSEIRLETIIPRGVFKHNEDYWRGDLVAVQGSGFIAKVDHPKAAPETEAGALEWQLYIKRGKNGIDGVTPRGLEYRGWWNPQEDYSTNNFLKAGTGVWIAKRKSKGIMPPIETMTENEFWGLLWTNEHQA